MQPFTAAVAASIIVKRSAKNHVLLLHLDEKLQKVPMQPNRLLSNKKNKSFSDKLKCLA